MEFGNSIKLTHLTMRCAPVALVLEQCMKSVRYLGQVHMNEQDKRMRAREIGQPHGM